MVPNQPKPQIEKRPMLYAILPLQRFAVASRLSRPARSFFSTPSFLKKPARRSQYGGTATNACRAASMAARRSSDLFGGSTGVLICTLQHGTCRARHNKRRSGFCASAGKPVAALTSRAPDCQLHPPAFRAGGEPAGRSQVPRARIRAPIPYYLREVPYARRSNRPLINSSQCEAFSVQAD